MVNQSLKDKIKSYEEQINNLKNDNEECRQLKQELKLLKTNITRKDEMIYTNQNKIKQLTTVIIINLYNT